MISCKILSSSLLDQNMCKSHVAKGLAPSSLGVIRLVCKIVFSRLRKRIKESIHVLVCLLEEEKIEGVLTSCGHVVKF